MSLASLYFSRATLRRDVPAAALRALLVPRDASARVGAGHKMVWTLFGDRPDRERDFLWREADAGVYYFLSRRPPDDRHGLFTVDPPKLFAPALAAGDRLRFALRANATVAKKAEHTRQRGKPCDVVMDALYHLPKGERAEARRDAIADAGTRWLEAQGERCGFGVRSATSDRADGVPSAACVIGYRTLRVDHAGPAARIGVIDYEGELEVRDPARFVAALGNGFGRAKAFGCGLMLVRRPHSPS
jgi:CRISPR system Cascade subunit CasE